MKIVNFQKVIIILFSGIIMSLIPVSNIAQTQHITGKGTSNYQDAKSKRAKHDLQKKGLSENNKNEMIDFSSIPDNENKKNHLLFKTKSESKDTFNHPFEDVYFGNWCYYYYYDSLFSNVSYLFSTFIDMYSSYAPADITVIIDFGDGFDTIVNPDYYYYDTLVYDSTMFITDVFHSYSSAGTYLPVCTVITSSGDTAIVPFYNSLYINSDPIPQTSFISFDLYPYQWCNTNNVESWVGVSFSTFYPDFQSITDTVEITINYGDGSDTIIKAPLYDLMYLYWWSWNACPPYILFSDNYHAYSQAGSYTVSCSVKFPDGTIIDTTSTVNFVADSCIAIGGKVFVDNNNNCTYDAGEIGVPDVWLYIPYYWWDSIPVNGCYYFDDIAVTDSSGDYAFYIPNSCQISDTIILDTYWNYYPLGYLPLTCPSTGYYAFNTDYPSLDYNFAFSCQDGFDLRGHIWGWRFRPGFQGYIYPFFGNYQCDSISGTATLVLSHNGFLSIDSVTPAPASIVGDTIIWNFTNLSISDWWSTASVYVYTDPTANEGDTIQATLILEPITGDNIPSNNIITENFIVTNSWDPNDKNVSPKGQGPQGLVPSDQELTYIIRFQNTGSDTAYNINIIDTINPNLNMTSLKIVASSHYMQHAVSGNIINFNFPYIMLPDSNVNEPASNGFVCYSIQPHSNMPEGTPIHNTAYIYFDYNPAVVTNTTVNTISYFVGIKPANANRQTIVYPNPANTEIIINLGEIPQDGVISMYDLLGNEIFKTSVYEQYKRIDITNFSSGFYFLQVQDKNNKSIFKVVIDSDK